MPRSASWVSARAASRSTPPASTTTGATHTLRTPSNGAIQASRDPSGDSLGLVRSGLPKSTLRGMSSTMRIGYSGARAPRLPEHLACVTGGFRWMSGRRYTVLPVSGIRTSLAGRLARMGLADVPRAERMLAELGVREGAISPEDEDLLAALATAADPDLALSSLGRIAERDRAILAELRGEASFRERLIAALGASAALADHLVRHPADRSVLLSP